MEQGSEVEEGDSRGDGLVRRVIENIGEKKERDRERENVCGERGEERRNKKCICIIITPDSKLRSLVEISF